MARRDKRREIMQAAEKLFASRRYHEITTDAVAHEAGVGKGTMYRHFRDKDDLFFQTAVAGFDELCDLVRGRVTDSQPFAKQLLAACREISEFFEERRELFRMMQAEDFRIGLAGGTMHERWLEHRKKLVAAVADIIRKGVGEGEIRRDVPPEVLANFLLGMLRTRARDLADASEAGRRLDVVVDVFCCGAGRNAAAGRSPGRRVAHAGKAAVMQTPAALPSALSKAHARP